MSDATESSLAITEKRPHKPGGCVGIFFQLFDWNRRFAKKKLFSKKLLGSARAKQASKKFGADDELPKLRLIADENSGGFPNVKKNGARGVDSEQKHGMRAPSLVARLMGLESMPAVKQCKLKEAPPSDFGREREDRSASNERVFGNEDWNFEKGSTKNQVRPQKLQKTAPCEGRPVTRFAAEALQLKNVLSRPRKHYLKLASPVKSPKSLSARSASRLIGAATKILEPGLQARSRMKFALPYSDPMHHSTINEVMSEATTALSPDGLDPSKNSNYYMSVPKSFVVPSSCKSCGNLLDDMGSRPNIEDRPPILVSSIPNYVNPHSQSSERSKPRSPVSSLEQEKGRIKQNGQEHSASVAAQTIGNKQPRAVYISDRIPPHREGGVQWHLTGQQDKHLYGSPSFCYKNKTQRQHQASMGKDRVPPRSKFSKLQNSRVASARNAINEAKDFVALNRSLSGRSRSRMPAKVDTLECGTERRFYNRREDSLSPLRKRSSMNVSRQGESTTFVRSTLHEERNINRSAVTGEEMGRNAQSMNHACSKSRVGNPKENVKSAGSGNNDSNVVSFTFSSPMKHKSRSPAQMNRRMDENGSTCNTSPQKDRILDQSDGNTCFKEPFSLTGDTLGALLEQKLRELTCQDEDESAVGSNPPKKTSAMILQELISALNAEKPPVRYDGNSVSDGCISNSSTEKSITQAKPKTMGAPVRYSCDYDHLSPGSVLEASFSNDSCCSSSLDDTSGHKMDADFVCSFNEPRPLEPDADLLDSSASYDRLAHISEVLSNLDVDGARIKGSKFSHAKEVILKAEIVIGSAILHDPRGTKGFSVSHFLINELETLASVMWTHYSCFLSFEDLKEGSLLKGFLFDCVIEYLDKKYVQYTTAGFKAWTRLPLCRNAETLIREVVEEVRRWTSMAGMIPDEIIEREMSCSLGKWTDFDNEAFETGVELELDILQTMVDEVVRDLWESRLSFSAITYNAC
ncbi:hypothetical protein RJ639_031008 [Escallonia herrerae]|uniref:DUF4378 domain-containing protein n=1 Tax=Escallonia herrerae TaxID=1293975 RepID=A0AA88WYE2_9ASTE|nr:hypothetical protein RJ639_031008 [Escallonia herrerae]